MKRITNLPALVLLIFAFVISGAPGHGETEIVAVVLEENISRDDGMNPDGEIFSVLLERFAEERNIHGTEEEVDAFVARQNEQQKRMMIDREKELDQVNRELEDSSLSDEDRARLDSRKTTIERLLLVLSKREASSKSENVDMTAAMRQLAERVIRKSKIDQALCKKYGGRVIYQQSGPEPLDAYREFLKEEQGKGSFKFVDPEAEKDFWNYFTDDKMHVFVPDGQAEEVIDTPWWLGKQGVSP